VRGPVCRPIAAQGVLALTGYQGSAGVEAALPVLDTAGVPMVGVASSAESLREPARRWLFNRRGTHRPIRVKKNFGVLLLLKKI
jgi:ABC-type branched-subunit amino acid transport system substrate-binding protein